MAGKKKGTGKAKGTQKRKNQQGGFLPFLAPILGAVASSVIPAVIDKIRGKGMKQGKGMYRP